MRRKLAFAVALVAISVHDTMAQDVEAMKLAANNFAHEHMICAAYFSFVSECMKTRPDLDYSEDLSKRYQGISDTMVSRGLRFAKEAGVSEKASAARYTIAMKEMAGDIDQSCANISVLFAKHSDRCVMLAERPRDRLRELMGVTSQDEQ